MSKKLILGVTLGGSSRLLDGQAKYFRELGYKVFLISQDHYKEHIFCQKEGITHLPVNIDNKINPIKDIIALFQIIKHFKIIKPDIVNVGTPKMGFLGILAAYLVGVRKRIYTCRGLRFETEKGFKRWLLMLMELITVTLAKKVIYVSPSLINAAKRYGVCKESKSVILGNGSSNGVDLQAFNIRRIDAKKRQRLIEEYKLEGKTIIGFVGRVSKHKGAYELVEAFEQVQKYYPDTVLIMVGHIDCTKDFEQHFRKNSGIIHFPFQDDVPLFMSLFDIFVLPSWREGFPNVPIQAAAMGIPVIISDATGCVDSVNKNVNGLVFKARDREALQNAIIYYFENEDKRAEHGKEGIKWAKKFTQESIWKGINQVYNEV